MIQITPQKRILVATDPILLRWRMADQLRDHLKEAGVDRAELFESSDCRRPIRIHDLRATFVTISLATGKSEAWVCDRTGHRSSQMVNRYRRAARSVAELGLGELARLDEAIPELRPEGQLATNWPRAAEGAAKAQIADKEKPSEVAGFPLVGHEGLASG